MHDGAIGRDAYDCFRSAEAESGARIAMEVTMLLAISRPRPVFFNSSLHMQSSKDFTHAYRKRITGNVDSLWKISAVDAMLNLRQPCAKNPVASTRVYWGVQHPDVEAERRRQNHA